MKKMMFLLAFASIGLFAKASIAKVSKVSKVSKIVKIVKKTAPKNREWMWIVTCGGQTYTGCCYGSQAGAYQNGAIFADLNCN